MTKCGIFCPQQRGQTGRGLVRIGPAILSQRLRRGERKANAGKGGGLLLSNAPGSGGVRYRDSCRSATNGLGRKLARRQWLAATRFVSLKSDRVNMRNGPGTDYPTAWVYRRAGLPLEVIKEFEGWRQVRDADGAAGWVLQSFLSGRRTALVLPWEIKQGVPAPKIALRRNDSDRARAVAMIEAGVIANLSSCDGRWCRVSIDKFQGYIEQKKLWGVYEGEVIN